MKNKHPHCAQCRNPLGVRAGVVREGKRFCNDECAYLYFGPPEPILEHVVEQNVFDAELGRLKKQNPKIDEAGILALCYLQWVKVPSKGTEDYRIYQAVRSWSEQEP